MDQDECPEVPPKECRIAQSQHLPPSRDSHSKCSMAEEQGNVLGVLPEIYFLLYDEPLVQT